MGVEFARPWWLAALVPLAAFLVAVRLPWWHAVRRLPAATRRAALRREQQRLGLRLAWLSLLVLSLAGTTLTRPLRRQAVVFVLDASASVATVRDQAEADVRRAAAQLRRGDTLGVVAAAAGAQVEEMPAGQPLFRRLAAALPASATDLAAGMRLAAAVVPPGYTGRIVLVSDGRQTRGDAARAARELAARGLIVDTLSLGEPAPDVRLDSIALPENAYRGEQATLTVGVSSSQATAAAIRVYRDDQLLVERSLPLAAGRQDVALAVPVGEPGLHRYRVDVAPTDPAVDGTAANDTLGAIQRVVGPPRVLVVAGSAEAAGMLPAAFQAGGAEVTVGQPAGVPADLAGWARYDTVALVDVPAEALPPGAMDLLEAYVRDLGRGLIMTGGAESFGPGGYAGTPVEQALPVYMDISGRGRQPRVAMALVIDRSGSMSGQKMEMAKEAAARSVRLLRPDDQAAILAFDSTPQWVAPLTPVTQQAALEQAIGGIYAGGGTEIYPAVSAAFDAVRDAQADVKHLILLTDGMSASGGDYGALTQQMRAARVTLSTVAVGTDADTTLLEALARAGRGRYHFVADPKTIPQVFARETIMATRSLLVDTRFFPAAAASGPLLRGLASVPPLDGYVAVTPKERAEVVLVSPDGDPVLAAWQYGTGRAVAWTPDVAGRWSSAWASSPAGATLWGNVLSWLLPPQEAGELAVRVETEPDGAFAVVAENRGNWDQVRPTHATVVGPEGQAKQVDLAPAGPGRYRARLDAPAPGAYVVRVAQPADGGAELGGETGWVAPYPAEYREFGPDQTALAQIAAAGGGRVLRDPTEAVAPAARPAVARWPLWPLLLILAAICWPLEIAARRLALTDTTLRPLADAHAPRWLTAAAARLPSNVGGLAARAAPNANGHTSPAAGAAAAATAASTATAQRLLDRKRRLREEREDQDRSRQ